MRIQNLLSVEAVKYTTFRAVSERVGDIVAERLGSTSPSATATTQLYGGEIDDLDAYIADMVASCEGLLSEMQVIRLVSEFGTAVESLIADLRTDKTLIEPIAPHVSCLRGEIPFIAKREMVVTLSDIILRRTGLGALGNPGIDVLSSSAELCGAQLGWNEST